MSQTVPVLLLTLCLQVHVTTVHSAWHLDIFCSLIVPGWSLEVVELCKKYRHEGVVAIDLAGDESLNTKANPEHREAYMVRIINYTLCNVCSFAQEITCNSFTDASKQ